MLVKGATDGDIDLVNTGSDNGLLPDDTKNIILSNVHFPLMRFGGIYLRAIPQQAPKLPLCVMSL